MIFLIQDMLILVLLQTQFLDIKDYQILMYILLQELMNTDKKLKTQLEIKILTLQSSQIKSLLDLKIYVPSLNLPIMILLELQRIDIKIRFKKYGINLQTIMKFIQETMKGGILLEMSVLLMKVILKLIRIMKELDHHLIN